jgi:hypothetical protein
VQRSFAIVLSLLCLASISLPAHAYQFGAREDVAKWIAEPSTDRVCELHHPIPEYGEAVFSQRAGQALVFELNSMRPLAQTDNVDIHAVAPAWLHQIDSKHLGLLSSQTGLQPVFTAEPLASQILDELQGGLFPVITHIGWSAQHPVEVAVSSVNFADAYTAFQTCVANLMPGDFGDIERTTVLFDTDKTLIKPLYQQRLKQVAAYVLKNDKINSVLVEGHTDSIWKKDYNIDLARRRAESVKQFLLEQGLPESRLEMSFHGETKPAAPNNTPENRQKNRRVVIALDKSPPASEKKSSKTVPDSAQAKTSTLIK